MVEINLDIFKFCIDYPYRDVPGGVSAIPGLLSLAAAPSGFSSSLHDVQHVLYDFNHKHYSETKNVENILVSIIE